MMALRRVQNDLAALHARGRRIPVLLTLSAETLGHPRNRAGYFASVRDIPEAARRLLFIEAHASPQLVAVAAQCVREADARLALRCALNASGMRALRQVGASLVIANAESFPTLTKVLLDALDQFAEQAALCGLECALSGVRSESVAIAAVTAGFRFIAGPVVSAPLALLSEALRFHPADLYEADGR